MTISILGRAPIIQQPIRPEDDKPTPLEPFVFPPIGAGEVAKPRVLALAPRVRGKRNPIHALSVGGQDFMQYRLPADATVVGANPALVRPNLPVVALTDKQVAAIKARAKLIHIRETFRPPPSDTDALAGYVDITADEIVVITDYVEHGDPFALAIQAVREAEATTARHDPEPVVAGADELQKAENALRASNNEPQRTETKPNGKPKTH